jgi:cyclase
MKRHLSLAFTLCCTLCLLAASAKAQAGQRVAPSISVTQLRDGVYFAEPNAGGNAGFIVGDNGVIVFDATTSPALGKLLLAEIAKVTPKPVTTVILSHSDGDHTSGLASFPTGLTIIAHENCKADLVATANTRNPFPQDHLPNKTLTKSETVTIDGVKLQILHFAAAHTSGDLQLYLPQQKIVFTGDVIATNCCGNVRGPQVYTLIHPQKNGSGEGWVRTVKGLLALNADTYLPGHGEVQTKADVQQRFDRVETRFNAVKKLVAQGKTLEQVKQALPDTGLDPSLDPVQFPDFTTVVYNELTRKQKS